MKEAIFDIRDYGAAETNSAAENAAAIQRAIDAPGNGGADQYLRDSISIFEELGWDWIYHEYREFRGWNVEIEALSRGRNAQTVPSPDNPRKRAVLDGLAMSKLDWSAATLVGSLGRDNPFFAPGEEMAFSITLDGFKGELPPDTFFIDWKRRGDDGITENGRVPLPTHGEPVVIRTKMDVPGFVRLTANVVTKDGKLVRKNHRWEPRVFFEGGAARRMAGRETGCDIVKPQRPRRGLPPSGRRDRRLRPQPPFLAADDRRDASIGQIA
ncbi:MAG: hypothetical protein IKO55_18055 [Kiritimatiellae bacterium]|nr:hypothetical protein [Kiritimatiellia bacterium]